MQKELSAAPWNPADAQSGGKARRRRRSRSRCRSRSPSKRRRSPSKRRRSSSKRRRSPSKRRRSPSRSPSRGKKLCEWERTRRKVSVRVRGADGAMRTVSKTVYRSRTRPSQERVLRVGRDGARRFVEF